MPLFEVSFGCSYCDLWHWVFPHGFWSRSQFCFLAVMLKVVIRCHFWSGRPHGGCCCRWMDGVDLDVALCLRWDSSGSVFFFFWIGTACPHDPVSPASKADLVYYPQAENSSYNVVIGCSLIFEHHWNLIKSQKQMSHPSVTKTHLPFLGMISKRMGRWLSLDALWV